MSRSLEGKMVNSLFKERLREWDADIVRDVFDDRDVEIIMGIPLSATDDENLWFWMTKISGLYSVKSTYSWLQSAKNVNYADDNFGFWMKLWQLKVPQRLRI